MISRYVGGALGLLLVASSPGQSIGAGFLSSPRPSDLSPSTRVGRVAGGATGPSAPSARSAGGYSGPTGSNLPAFRGFGTGIDPDYDAYNRAFRPSMARRWFPRTNPGSLINAREGVATVGDLYMVTALAQATSMDIPLIGWESPRLPLEQGRVYVPPGDASPFHQFFRVARIREIEAPLIETHLSAADRMGVINQGYIDDLMSRAKAAFKDGTTPAMTGREEYLAKAMDLCDIVRGVGQGRWEATMLHLHASLLKQGPERAAYDLVELAKSNPDVFKTRPDFSAYYGDAKTFLEEPFKDFMRRVEVSQPRISTSLVQAYCAWVVNDMQRLRLALGRVDDMNRADKNDADIDRARRAMLGAFATDTAAAPPAQP